MALKHISEELTSIVARMTDQHFVGYLRDLADDLHASGRPATANDIQEAAKRIELWCGFKCICGCTESYEVCTECGNTYND